MTRHTGEVDVYHLGQWAGLGTRHNVQHWGDSAKQQRISTAVYRRFYYFLTADERVGDLHARQLVDSDETFLVLDPIRKIRTEPYTPDRHALSIGFGTDWSGLAAAWLTEWERARPEGGEGQGAHAARHDGDDRRPAQRLRPGQRPVRPGHRASSPSPPSPGRRLAPQRRCSASVEICAELIDLIDMPEFERGLAATTAATSTPPRPSRRPSAARTSATCILLQGHSRLDAYAAVRLGDDRYATRAWRIFNNPPTVFEIAPTFNFTTERITTTLNPTDWREWVATNDTSMYALAAIQNLALIGDKL